MAMLLARVEEAASFLGIAPSTIHRWIGQDKVQVVTVRGETQRRVIVEQVQEVALKEGRRSLGQARKPNPAADRRLVE